MTTRYEQKCESIRLAAKSLKITRRTIISDREAIFTLSARPERLLGPITVVISWSYVVIFGDWDTCSFARYSGGHWRGAIHWIGRSDCVTGYILEKAHLGMGCPVTEFCPEQAKADIIAARRYTSISREVARECIEILSRHDGVNLTTEGELVQELWREGAEDLFSNGFHVPIDNVINGHAVLRQLDQLLDEEERLHTCPRILTSDGSELKYYPGFDLTERPVIATGLGRHRVRYATKRHNGEWLVHCSLKDAQAVVSFIQSLPEEDAPVPDHEEETKESP